MHPGFALGEEIAVAAHDEMESMVTAHSSYRDLARKLSSENGKETAHVPLLFQEYAFFGPCAEWKLVAIPQPFMRVRMAIQTDIKALSEKKEACISEAI